MTKTRQTQFWKECGSNFTSVFWKRLRSERSFLHSAFSIDTCWQKSKWMWKWLTNWKIVLAFATLYGKSDASAIFWRNLAVNSLLILVVKQICIHLIFFLLRRNWHSILCRPSIVLPIFMPANGYLFVKLILLISLKFDQTWHLGES